ncbi:MAG TPA: ABC transporter substrate-binding protein [Candidatus Dormibacteraeota bacterium]|jgi:iron complex transport system substrate-binding protein|nr:ABC transporter substrate-binding protein [Candidatus Dormibacteraeota bacterium]
MQKHRSRLAFTAFISIALAACGATSSGSPASSQSAHFPVTIVEAGGASVTITKQPQRIVSLSPTATEMLFAIAAGSQVVAVDDQSTFPSNAPVTKLSGFQPNVEAIAAYAPDLVVAADDTGGIVHGLGALNVPILIEPAAKNLDDSYRQIEQLGAATGRVTDASALEKKMRSDLAAIVASLPRPAKQLKVYHELDDTYYSATSSTFIGQVYELLGLRNIADGATAAAPDYPQLSAEYIVSSSPDLIVLADTKCCHQDMSTVAARPGWSSIAAVKSGQVVGVDDDIASRWGPRVVDFLRAIAPHVKQLEAQAA